MDVHIHRCTLRVVRRGGWSWGAEPQRWLEAALARLRDLLAASFTDLPVDEADEGSPVHLERVRVRLGLTADQLLALAMTTALDPPGAGIEPAWPAAIRQQVVDAVRTGRPRGLGASTVPGARPSDLLDPAPSVSEHATHAPIRGVASVERVLGFLGRSHAAGELGVLLRTVPDAMLQAWHRLLAVGPPSDSQDAIVVPSGWHDALSAAFVRPLPATATRDRRLARWLFARTVLWQQVGAGSGERLSRALAPFAVDVQPSPVDEAPSMSAAPRTAPALAPGRAGAGSVADVDAGEAMGAMAAASDETRGAAALSGAVRHAATPDPPAATTPSRITRSAARPGPPAAHGTVHVDCALPFLMLGPLARMGWMDGLEAACLGAERPEAMGALAAAVALVALDPPERGWRRSPSSRAAAAAFAGWQGFEPDAFAALTRDAADLMAPGRSLLGRSTVRGSSGDALLLRPSAAGWWLLEQDGLFPFGVASDPEALFDAIGPMPSARVALPTDAMPAAPAVSAAGHHWVTDAPPTRGERPRALRRDGLRLWTGDRLGPEAPLVRAGRDMSSAVDYADDAIGALCRRAPDPRRLDGPLSVGALHVAGIGLATMSWHLFRDRETSSPILPLRRFADLSARVDFAESTVAVTLPLGARTRHLREAGLLEPIRRVPWLGDRTLELRGG